MVPMCMSVLYFAKSAELTGHKSETIRDPSELMTLELAIYHLTHYESVALGDQRISLRDGNEVAVIPPLSGG
uniref:Molybdopterin synthase sulfur carrier subunit n=1 Tax=Hucho hucho TaxID=62062 RepID=A0A4W5M944_9TELE